MTVPNVIPGASFSDERGIVSFVNEFKMDEVKRFYVIKPADTTFIRGWRAHRIEQRWFYVSNGTFQIKVIKVDNWETPDKGAEQITFELNADNSKILHIPRGYATSLQALSPNSELIVFGDYGIEHAENDNYLYPNNYFVNIAQSEN